MGNTKVFLWYTKNMKNNSPWLSQLQFKRISKKVESSTSGDLLIVGGGIAGIVTAYFLLKNTDQSVILIEADKIAHGATGHNAGQVTSYFERHFVELVDDFGLELAAEGQACIEKAWDLLEEIIAEAQLKVPFHKIIGSAGYSTYEQIMFRLEEERLRQKTGLPVHEFLIADDPLILLRLPDDMSDLYQVVSKEKIMELLEATDRNFLAVKKSRKGCINSALFCEQLIEWLEKKYATRFQTYEHSPVKNLRLYSDKVVAEINQHLISAKRAVLCTNGFENINIHNEVGVEIDGRFHEAIEGTIGYMAGFISQEKKLPTVISYFEKHHVNRADPYIYLTRRPELGINPQHNLTCLGGPESALHDKSLYDRFKHEYPEEAKNTIMKFLNTTHNQNLEELKFDFLWHGLMGYTKNGVRMIGFEPCNQRLLYNLGCNGVGILPSIYGGLRISQLISGQNLPASIFDVIDQRCMT